MSGIKKTFTSNSLKHICINTFLVLCSALLILICLEAVLRLLSLNRHVRVEYITKRPCKHGLYQFDKFLGWKNRPAYESRCLWPYGDTVESINSRGWRDKEYSVAKKEGTYRIAAIGCSQTYGYGVNAEQAYPKILEKSLNRAGHKKYEVLNFGVNGYGLSQMLINYEKNIKNYKPDLVILQLYPPNIFRSTRTKMWGSPKPGFSLEGGKLHLNNYPARKNKWIQIAKAPLNRLFLFDCLKDKILKITKAGNNKDRANMPFDSLSLDTCAEILKLFKKLTTKNNSKLLVFTWGKDSNRIISMCKRAGVQAFVLGDYENVEKWAKIGALRNPKPVGHWSTIGHSFVASAIYRYLKNKWNI